MKRIVFALIAIACLSASSLVFAQGAGPGQGTPPGRMGGPRGGGMRMGQMENEILAKLKLTGTQKSKVKTLQESTAKSMKAVFDKMQAGKLARDQVRPQMQAIRKTHEQGMKGILSASQFKQYKDLMAEKMKEMRAARAARGSAPRKP